MILYSHIFVFLEKARNYYILILPIYYTTRTDDINQEIMFVLWSQMEHTQRLSVKRILQRCSYKERIEKPDKICKWQNCSYRTTTGHETSWCKVRKSNSTMKVRQYESHFKLIIHLCNEPCKSAITLVCS